MPPTPGPDDELLRRVLRRAYGHLAPTTRPAATPLDESPHRLWSARLTTGQEVVLKFGPPPDAPLLTQDADRVRGEVEALQMIAEHTDVPVPTMHQVDDTFELVDADWLCMEFLDGIPLDRLGVDDQRRLMPLVEAAMTRLEAIEGNGFGRFLQPQLDSWGDAFTGCVEDLLADAVRLEVDLGCSSDEIHHQLLAHTDELDAVTTPHFVEWDRRPGDVLVADGSISAILDHTGTLWGDPLLASRWMSATQPGLSPWSGALQPQLPELDAAQTARRRLYDVFVMIVEVLRRREDPAALGPARQALRRTLIALQD